MSNCIPDTKTRLFSQVYCLYSGVVRSFTEPLLSKWLLWRKKPLPAVVYNKRQKKRQPVLVKWPVLSSSKAICIQGGKCIFSTAN